MSQQMVRRFVTVGTLAAILFVGGAGSVQARDFSPGNALSWLQELWAKGVPAVWGGAGTPVPVASPRSSGIFLKEGPGVDPNGVPRPSSLTIGCTTCSDGGLRIDPNGL
jgi:hypothetical protein